MRRLIVYSIDVASIITAGKLVDDNTVVAHESKESVEAVVRTRLFDEAVYVSRRRNPAIDDILSQYVDRYRYIEPENVWYAKYVTRHLLEPRIKEVGVVSSYFDILFLEYKTISIICHILGNTVPLRVGSTLFVYTRKAVPTLDTAIALTLKYREPSCVASERDTGLSLACVGDEDSILSLLFSLKKIATTVRLYNDTTLIAFIVTYPQSPNTVKNDVLNTLREVEMKPPTLTQQALKKFPFAEKASEMTFLKYLRMKMRLNWDSVPRIELDRPYIVLKHVETPAYEYRAINGTTIYNVYAPTRYIAVQTRTRNPTIIVEGREVEKHEVLAVYGGYVHILPPKLTTRIISKLKNKAPGKVIVAEQSEPDLYG